jgi:hypothetical protein
VRIHSQCVDKIRKDVAGLNGCHPLQPIDETSVISRCFDGIAICGILDRPMNK